MNHVPEFSAPAKAPKGPDEMAACYARVFLGTDAGKRVLADLRAKFGLSRLTFVKQPGGSYDPLAAALIDGERHVMSEIENALSIGAPNQALSESPKP